MKNLPVLGFLLLALGVGGVYAWVRFRSEFAAPPSPLEFTFKGPPIEKHAVTPAMSEMSKTMLDIAAPAFLEDATDGASYSIDDARSKGPVVLTFIKNGCPCSDEAQVFFNRLAAAFPSVTFLGVIDTPKEKSQTWVQTFRVAYPLLLDTDLTVVRDYKVENSTYVVLIDREGKIRQHWPGFSKEMLRAVEARLAEETGTKPEPIDVRDAPDNLYSGCPF